MRLHHRRDLLRLTESAVAVALSVLLGNIRLLELPNGGSIALATIPLLSLSLMRGARVGMLAGCCAGMAHALSGGTIIHPAQLGLDYLVAYGALGLAGVGGGARAAIRITCAMAAHLSAMVLSGVLFFSAAAGSAALAYSLIYNAMTVLPELALALWLAPPLARAIARAGGESTARSPRRAAPALVPRQVPSIRRAAPPAPQPVARTQPATLARRPPFTQRQRLS